MNGIIYIFGPSCSGKSTLSQALQHRLGDRWTYLDRDLLIESGLCRESSADKALEQRVQAVKNRIIIDAQIPWREKREDDIYCLLLPSLKTLLDRNALRTKNHNWSEHRAFSAKKYVIDTHTALVTMARDQFDICFDSSLPALEDEVLKVLQFLENKLREVGAKIPSANR